MEKRKLFYRRLTIQTLQYHAMFSCLQREKQQTYNLQDSQNNIKLGEHTLKPRAAVGMGIPMGIPVGMGWIWGLKCHPHGSPAKAHRSRTFRHKTETKHSNSLKVFKACFSLIEHIFQHANMKINMLMRLKQALNNFRLFQCFVSVFNARCTLVQTGLELSGDWKG